MCIINFYIFQPNLVTKEDIEATKTSVEVSCLPRRLLFCFSVVAFTLVVIVLALIFTITPNDNGEEKDSSPGNYTEEYNISGHEYYTRADWGGREPKWVDEIEGQVTYVIVSHTVTDQCKTFQECANIMRLMQDIHVNDGSPNIGYNFVIGGDANVYEGRGWFAQNFHKFDRNSLGISFTGNYVYDELDSNMMDVFMLLLELGVELRVLSPNYRIVAHNQTLNTISPGVNIYKEIKYMPNFYEYMQPRIEMDDDQ